MGKWQDYDPHSGMLETNSADDETGMLTVHKQQDVEPLLDRNAALANSGATDIGIKKGFWHYASIPPVVQYEILTKYGVDITKREDTARLLEIINRDYPKLKTTHKNHYLPRKGTLSAVRSMKPGKS